ncbi:hypothetical protein K469DRAFT_697685 [Zopfia rhizophila CBS 207.26]|uniref:Uncharacterized protein n=1 Tax=Zopfia rhizophila CBS 207.26 TaxID=1314779 RepID=A0A6A6EFA6_9PEZI|nr:hypothetical protein K469DRAFT_697685 [Zopfia rhizophila CBS 207.26]
MVIPGVCDQTRCPSLQTHFVSNWRLCEPVEYATTLADHGITYTDYSRLIAALADFISKLPKQPKRKAEQSQKSCNRRKTCCWSEEETGVDDEGEFDQVKGDIKMDSIIESVEEIEEVEQQAAKLNVLLADITSNWQIRGAPVMVCLSSLSLSAKSDLRSSRPDPTYAVSMAEFQSSREKEALNCTPRISGPSFHEPFRTLSNHLASARASA